VFAGAYTFSVISSATIVPGVTDTGNHTSAIVSSIGNIQLALFPIPRCPTSAHHLRPRAYLHQHERRAGQPDCQYRVPELFLGRRHGELRGPTGGVGGSFGGSMTLTAAAVASVPEPGTGMLAAFGGAVALLSSRLRRRNQ
jgi:hypothetical protein